MRRIKAAFRTNEPQAVSVGMFTILNLIAASSGPRPATIGLYAFALLLWPTLAFLANLSSPIPKK